MTFADTAARARSDDDMIRAAGEIVSVAISTTTATCQIHIKQRLETTDFIFLINLF